MISQEKMSLLTEKPVTDNVMSVISGLSRRGYALGLNKPHRLAHYLAQLAHESAGFKYDEEIASGRAYEGRSDLGNVNPGDGVKFKGRGPIQITGRANYGEFTNWCRKFAPEAPSFVENPDKVKTDPWEGLAPIWYWETRGLNRYADQNDIEMITKRINGGLNGYSDRVRWYTRAALVLLGFGPNDVYAFQKKAGLSADGITGPRTRAALHGALVRVKPIAEPRPAPGFIEALIALISSIFGGNKYA